MQTVPCSWSMSLSLAPPLTPGQLATRSNSSLLWHITYLIVEKGEKGEKGKEDRGKREKGREEREKRERKKERQKKGKERKEHMGGEERINNK